MHLYPWLVFLHVLSAFVFVLSHGASATVAVALRWQREPERIRALLDLSAGTVGVSGGSLVLTLVTGIIVGFAGHWWGRGWIWASLVLLVATGAAMSILGAYYFNQVRGAVGLLPTYGGKKGDAPPAPASPEELEALLRSRRPIAVSVIGIVGLVAILWLMVLKPF